MSYDIGEHILKSAHLLDCQSPPEMKHVLTGKYQWGAAVAAVPDPPLNPKQPKRIANMHPSPLLIDIGTPAGPRTSFASITNSHRIPIIFRLNLEMLAEGEPPSQMFGEVPLKMIQGQN